VAIEKCSNYIIELYIVFNDHIAQNMLLKMLVGHKKNAGIVLDTSYGIFALFRKIILALTLLQTKSLTCF
jgi:hypothetical protein